jgi:type II secretory pathway component GspD/PulD (secretin)
VRIPDKGSILIGGLKNITTIDRQSETPVLGKIPFLSFLFSRKGRSDEMSNLMILVNAEITDLAAQEEMFMSAGGPIAPMPLTVRPSMGPCR